MDHVISVCNRCRLSDSERDGTRAGMRLFEAVADEFARWALRDRFRLQAAACMSNCKRPCTAVLSAPGKYAYMFGDLPPERATAQAILDGAAVYAAKPDGFMERSERPEALRKTILARIPWVG
jgi:predicted metal-binding protein